MIKVDLLVKNIREIVNPADDRVVRGGKLNSLRVSRGGWLGATGERISFIGSARDFKKHCVLSEKALVIDGSDYVAMPGLVDPHTHLPFAGTRQGEFREKLQGVGYQEIARRGGGIRGTVRQTRDISLEDLVHQSEQRLRRMLLAGTTTVEAKSGYGLDLESELKQLEALRALTAIQPVDIVPTFMGAHEIPPEFQGRNMDFIRYLVTEVSPVVKKKGLAEFADIFCEEGVFSYPEAEFYIDRLVEQGFRIKVHADEFISNNAATLAVRKGAVSTEHLIAITDEEIDVLAPSDTAAILLPGVSFFLKMKKYAPARSIIDRNGIVALGSDFNPGSSMVSSQLLIMQLGIYLLNMTIEESFNAVTINAAYSIDRQDRAGSLMTGKKMDLLLMDIPDYTYMAYHLGINPVHTVIKSGEVVVKNGRIV